MQEQEPIQVKTTEEPEAKPKKKWKWKRIRNRFFLIIAKYTLPYIYYLYIRFVLWTSKVVDLSDTMTDFIEKCEPHKCVAVLWHQDVFNVPWAYKKFSPITMASVGDSGEIITKILEMFQYKKIWRGGSSKGKKRHKKILDDFIADFKESQYSPAGITVDGSSGPPYRLKHGAVVIAKECQCPIFMLRLWAKRKCLLPTWDRTMVPLPFNKIVIYSKGPYFLPDVSNPEDLEKFRSYIENELLELTYNIFQKVDKKIPESCLAFFPENWKPAWPENTVENF
ncbi:MAG: hypothetical protein HUU50_23070 [Candidatus Brocadiae bacterium]|nr:hypothetical protein [Candidatus Brocadiia bacterium]